MPLKFIDPLRLITLPPAATASVLAAVQRLAAVDAAMDPHSDTREGQACLAAAEAISRCVRFAREVESAASAIFDGFKGPDGRLSISTEAARAAVPERVGLVASDRVSAVRSAEGKAVAEAATLAFVRAQEQLQAKANALGIDAKAAMVEVRDAILAAEAANTGPLAFRERLTLDDIAMIASVREGEAKTKSPSELARTFEGLVVAGDGKLEQLFSAAVETELRAIVAMTPPRLRERLGVAGPDTQERRGVVEKERKAASALLDRIRARAEERVPESLQLARLAEAELRGCFVALVGQHALSMSAAEYSQYKTGPRDPMKLAADWPTRLALATWTEGQR